MMKYYYRKIFICALSALLVLLPAFLTQADARPVSKKRRAAEAPAPEKKKTPYEKFISGKGVEKAEGFITVYRKGKDIWLEIPDSLEGRKFLLSTVLKKSSSVEIPVGMDRSSNPVYQIDRTDSLILFRRPVSACLTGDEGENIENAFAKSRIPATVKAFPIKYRNGDSTAVVIKATSLFSESDKSVFDMKGISLGNDLIASYRINSFTSEPSLSSLKSLKVEGNSICVEKEITEKLTLTNIMGFEKPEKPFLTLGLDIMLTLLPEKKFEGREVDDRLGLIAVPYKEYSSTRGIRKGKWAARMDISKGVKVYVDTLLPPSWRKAVKEGIENWNVAFREIGEGDVIEVLPYTADFRSSDPLSSIVTLSGGLGTSISADRPVDGSTSEILSCRIFIPGDYLTTVRRKSVYCISDVDARYSEYYLEDSAVCDYLRSDIMSLFGACLGLSTNYAGSAAYSPEQLRSAEFTREKGITASVTDGVRFNYLARPGDLERGVVTMTDRIGTYDRYAIRWLYGNYSRQQLDSLVSSHIGDPEYVYCGSSRKMRNASLTDLGNDVFAAFDAGMEHLRFVAANGGDWMDDSVPESYSTLFIDWLWLRYNSLSSMLASQIGALTVNDVRGDKMLPRYTALPKARQKAALHKYFEGIRSLSFMDDAKKLLRVGGMNRDVSSFTRLNAVQMFDLRTRLSNVMAASYLAGSDYSPEEFLQDVQDEVLKNLRTGRLAPLEEAMISSYIVALMSCSDVMKSNYAKATGTHSLTSGVDVIPESALEGMAPLCMASLRKAIPVLVRGRNACQDEIGRRKIDYLITIAREALGEIK